MNIQAVSSVNFGDLYYQNKDRNFSVTTNQRRTWSIVKGRLDPYVSDIVPSLEKHADVDVVLFYNPDGTTTLKLQDTYDKLKDKDECDNPETLENMRSPKLKVNFTNRDQKTWDGVARKLNNFINDCENYLKTAAQDYNKVKLTPDGNS